MTLLFYIGLTLKSAADTGDLHHFLAFFWLGGAMRNTLGFKSASLLSSKVLLFRQGQETYHS